MLRLLATSLTLCVTLWSPLFAGDAAVLQADGLTVIYREAAAGAAREVAGLYRGARAGVESSLGLSVDFKATVVLTGDRGGFTTAAGSDIIAAYAVPGRYLMVLDNSKVHEKPLALETTLRHELCHLVLHHHIRETSIPRWFDEGVCQWISGGVSEIVTDLKDSDIARASLGGRLIPLSRLGRDFPGEDAALKLAYAQSRSFVQYLAGEHGREGVLGVIGLMRQGTPLEEAFRGALSASVRGLEADWRESLQRRHTWLSYLSDNIYVLIFVLGGALTVYGFARVILRIRAYRDEEDEEP